MARSSGVESGVRVLSGSQKVARKSKHPAEHEPAEDQRESNAKEKIKNA